MLRKMGGYFHFSKSQICHPTYPMSPPITFRPWMDKVCENKFLGANSASPLDPLDFFKSPPLWGGTKRCARRVTHETAFWETVMDLFMRGSCFPGRSMATHTRKRNYNNKAVKMVPISSTSPIPHSDRRGVFWEQRTLSGNYVKFSITSPP